MRIGELCSRTGYNKDTIRFYEKIGLLPVERQGHGFKEYTDWHVLRLLHIKYAKAAGFTLNQMGDLLTNWVTRVLFPTPRSRHFWRTIFKRSTRQWMSCSGCERT